ncbi:MAG: 2-phosphosulfolactate phosphatase [Salinivirgaceae bacterium]
MSQIHVDISFSPELYPHYHRKGNLVVVIDLFRATTVITTALHNGAKAIIPVPDIESALDFRDQGMLIAGERDGDKLSEFDFGNSPLEFTADKVAHQMLAITTTNGTRAFAAVKNQHAIAGSLLNFSAVLEYIQQHYSDVVFLCSGWTMKVNIEDTLLAGYFAQQLLKMPNYYSESDSIAIAQNMLDAAADNWLGYILKSSPRLKSKQTLLQNDMEYALQQDYSSVVPVLKGNRLIRSQN